MNNDGNSDMRRLIPLWSGQLLSLMGSSIVQFALIWYVTKKTESVVVLSLYTLMNYIPIIFLATFIGNSVDKMNKKKVMIYSDLLSALCTLAFLVLVNARFDSVIFILVLFFIKSVCQQFQTLSMLVTVSKIAPEDRLGSTSGITQFVNGFSNLVAPLIGSFLIVKWSLTTILLLDVITALLGISAILFLRFNEGSVAKDEERKTLRQQISVLKKNGLVLRFALLAGFLNMVLTPSAAFLPILVNNELKMNASVLGMLETTFALGIAITGLLMGVIKLNVAYQKAIRLGLFCFGVMFVISGLIVVLNIPVYALYISLFLLGAFMSFANAEMIALFQSVVDKNEQGLFLGSVTALSTAMIPLGLLLGTLLTQAVSVKWWFVFAGIACIIVDTAFFSVIGREKTLAGAR